jgi:CRP/FNR family transcriptional regulator, cyclic AMP receptor protein
MKGETISFAPGQLVFREGDPCDGVYFIQEGKIEIFRERDGLAVSFGFQSAGEVLGTLSMFTREARAASAKAVSQVSLLHVNAETLDLGIKSIPVWALALLKDTVNRLKIVDERLVESTCSMQGKWRRFWEL